MTTPTREQVVQWEDEAEKKADAIIQMPGEYHPDWHTVYAEQLAIIARADLEATVKEQAAEIERLKADLTNTKENCIAWATDVGNLIKQLAAAQAENAKLNRDKYPFVHVRFDASTAETESAIRDRLIELGWAPPGELAAAQLHIEQLQDILADTTDFLERHSNRWDGINGKHPNDVITAAREALSTQPDLSAFEVERQRVAEACAKVCENDESGRDNGGYFADTIRAGQWREHL